MDSNNGTSHTVIQMVEKRQIISRVTILKKMIDPNGQLEEVSAFIWTADTNKIL